MLTGGIIYPEMELMAFDYEKRGKEMDTILRCNQCGKVFEKKRELYQEDFFEARKEWGYFSKKDFTIHEFLLCEDCYDRLTAGFQVPVRVLEKKEI